MAAHDINDVNYDEATSKVVVSEEVQGQPQAKPRPLDEGKVKVSEVSVQTDTVILDPNHELAVQVPDEAFPANPLAAALEAGTPEEQFAKGGKLPQSSDSVRKPKSDAPKS